MKKNILRIIIWTASIIIGLSAATAAVGGWYLYASNITDTPGAEKYYLYVTHYSTMDDVVQTLSQDGMLKRESTFRLVAKISKSEEKLKPGRYLIEPGLSNYKLLQKLRNGLQEPVKFTFNNINFIEDFCGKAGAVFHFDSLQMLEAMRDKQLLDSLGIKPEMLLGQLLPNTYEVYWTISPEGLLIRLLNESDRFWNEERKAQLESRGLTKDDVLILASIIQKETNHVSEMSRMAGVYINRLKLGMKLQADPTVKYAVGDLSIRRVLFRHLEHPSPWNTYYTEGLPPGVICAPNPATIDQILNYEEHDYLFFVANPGYNSTHTFAETHRQHEQNRARYLAWLRQEGIR
ncbi:MAG: endolytic transglycosylase MltG [Bacteroidales bacterium]